MMEKAITQMLDTKFEYKTDGLIFTPRQSGVAPQADLNGATWTRVYKWKPAEQNSIDFLVRLKPTKVPNTLTGVVCLQEREGPLHLPSRDDERGVRAERFAC